MMIEFPFSSLITMILVTKYLMYNDAGLVVVIASLVEPLFWWHLAVVLCPHLQLVTVHI